MSKLISVKLTDEETALFDQAVELLNPGGPKPSVTAITRWVIMDWVRKELRKVQQ